MRIANPLRDCGRGADVQTHGTHISRESAGRDFHAEEGGNQLLLAASRINSRDPTQLDALIVRLGDGGTERGRRLRRVVLDRDHTGLR